MNRVPFDRQVRVISGLVEGNSIRSVERMTDTHRDTIMRLMVRVGNGCARVMDEEMRNLTCRRLQLDEVWGYIHKKQRRIRPTDDATRVGDVWTFVAIDADTKLVPTYRVGKRDGVTANAFVSDLSDRLANRVQLSSDGLRAYVDAIERSFGADVDYGQVVKIYEAEPMGPGRYSPPHVVETQLTVITGNPDPAHISTSFVERQNLTMRMSMRRLTRLTNAFSKKIENFRAAAALHFAHYNFVRLHRSLRVTPAMAAGVSNRLWSIEELVERSTAN